MFKLKNISHKYDGKTVLSLPEVDAAQGDHWLLLGNSGSGKTTLLHILAGLLNPTSGSVIIGDKDLAKLPKGELDRFRGKHIGIIFQQMHLLPTLTVRENLLMAPYMAGNPQDPARVAEVLENLDIADKASSYPQTLSFGQQQRAAIARAVMNNPTLILADEPTSALDDVSCEQVIQLLLDQATRYNATLLIATHDQRIKSHFKHQLDLDKISREGA